MLAALQRRVRLDGLLHRVEQLVFKPTDPGAGGDPTLDHRRLDDDQLNLGDALEGPRLGPARSRSVEHQLHVLLGLNNHAIAELPVNDDGAVADLAQHIDAAKDAWDEVAKVNTHLDHQLHRLVRIDLIQQRQRWHDFVVVQFFADALRHLAIDDGRDDIVQQRTLGGVLALSLGRHLGRQGDGAGAVDDPAGGRAADDLTVR